MTTSGTVGKTKLNTSKLLDKAFRRCGINPATQTPEVIEQGLEDLFLLLMSLSSRGLNLWCIEKVLFPLMPNQGRYVLPEGTLSLLNVIHCLHTIQLPVTIDALPKTVVFDYGAETKIRLVRIGIRFNEALPVSEVSILGSPDGITGEQIIFENYGPQNLTTFEAGRLYWFDLKTVTEYEDIAVVRNNADPLKNLNLDTLYAVSQSSEIQVSQFNRDDYSAQPNKSFTSTRPTNFYFEKLVDPMITMWPLPNTDEHCLALYRYRQVQDIGDLQNEVEVPTRWLEAITWHLALRLAYEVPGAEARIAPIQQMVQQMTMEADADETDSAPTYFQPNIRVYTR